LAGLRTVLGWGHNESGKKKIDTSPFSLIRRNVVSTSNNRHNQSQASFNIDVCSSGPIEIHVLMYGRDNFGYK